MMAHSFMLALADPSIDAIRMFNVQWYVVRILGMMGYDKEEDEEEFEDVKAYNTRARIEMATLRTLKSVPRPRPC